MILSRFNYGMLLSVKVLLEAQFYVTDAYPCPDKYAHKQKPQIMYYLKLKLKPNKKSKLVYVIKTKTKWSSNNNKTKDHKK